MRILCVIDSLGSGGSQKQLVELAKGFVDYGHEVSFLTYHRFDFFNEELDQYHINLTCIEEPNYLRRLWKMRSFIRVGKYDAVLSFLEAPNFICELAGFPIRKWRLIVGERSANPSIKESLKLRVYRWFHFFSDYVVSNSYTNREIVRSVNPFISLEKLKVIYNLVDISSFKGNGKDEIHDKLILLIAASHRTVKNLNGLIEAVNLLTDEEKNKLRIQWYGNEIDSTLKDANNKIKKYNLESNFEFYNATSDINSKMFNAHVIGLFSFYEGFPNTICEAMSLGKPVICSSVSDIPMIINDKKYLFDPNVTSEISSALSFILTLSHEELKLIGVRNKVLSKSLFNRDQIVLQYLNLMQKE